MKHLTTALVLLLALGGNAAEAAHGGSHRGALHSVAQSEGITLDQAVRQVRRATGGRILSAETVSVDGRRVHRIKVLTPDHRVRTIRIRAE